MAAPGVFGRFTQSVVELVVSRSTNSTKLSRKSGNAPQTARASSPRPPEATAHSPSMPQFGPNGRLVAAVDSPGSAMPITRTARAVVVEPP